MHLPSLPAAVHHEAAPWIERMARVGFVAKALLYMTAGALAALAALGYGGKAAADQHGALHHLVRAPMGRVLLVAVASGLVGYAVWQVIDGIADPERHGRSPKGLVMRGHSILSALVHGGLALTAAKLAMGHPVENHGSREAQHWTAKALATPGGTLVIMIAAGVFVGYGVYQLSCAIRAKLGKELSLGSMGQTAKSVVMGISRFGIAARGIVFGMIGVLLFRAAHDGNPKQAGGVARSMAELFQWGTGPFTAIAVGLIAYGGYQLLNARYRRIDVG